MKILSVVLEPDKADLPGAVVLELVVKLGQECQPVVVELGVWRLLVFLVVLSGAVALELEVGQQCLLVVVC